MPQSELSVSVSVDLEKAVYDMVDIVSELDAMVELVPAWNSLEAKAHKRRAVDTMLKWLDSYAK